MTKSERQLFAAAEPEMRRCRPGDWEHALRVAKWARQLGEGRSDEELLVTAALIHDLGWRDVVPSSKKITLAELLAHEPQANANSEPYVTEFLQRFKFGRDDIETILRLVRAADAHEAGSDDEAIIVDADNLSKLDINHLKQKFRPAEWPRMYELWKAQFPNRVTTEKGKAVFPALLDQLHRDILAGEKAA